MTNEEAIALLNRISLVANESGKMSLDKLDAIDAVNIAVRALEKQIPKKPIILELDTYSTSWKCPTCGRRLASNALPKCCDECGQIYDWSDYDDE